MRAEFVYEGRRIEYELILRPRKQITIEVNKEGQVTVLAPPGISPAVITKQVLSKAGWIIKQIERFEGMVPVREPLAEGARLLYLGDEYSLHLQRGGHNKVMLAGRQIVVHTLFKEEEIVKAMLEAWYRQQAGQIIGARVAHYEGRIAPVPGRICIKAQKRRWGSCSARGNLNFNWRLVMASPEIIDYVVVHELCHLVELNHSDRFWHLLAGVLPDYRKSKEWLKNNGLKLDWQ